MDGLQSCGDDVPRRVRVRIVIAECIAGGAGVERSDPQRLWGLAFRSTPATRLSAGTIESRKLKPL